MDAMYLFELRGKQTPVVSLEAASRLWETIRDASGLDASHAPTPHILNAQGKHLGYVSYNGRIWAGWPCEWKAGDQPLYDNRTSHPTKG
jgi:hypothetical protein